MKQFKANYNFNISFALFLSVFLIIGQSCDNIEMSNRKAIAIVGNEKLFIEDVHRFIPPTLQGGDSVKFINDYVDKWATDQLLYQKAKSTLWDTLSINAKVNKYRMDLYIHKYKEKEILSNLNSYISQSEIIDFYNNNLNAFVLNEAYVKAYYLSMTVHASTYFRERYAVMNTEINNHQTLLELAEGTGRNAVFYDDWIKLNDLLGEIGYSEEYNPERLLRDSMIINVEDNTRYIVKVFDVKLEGDTASVDIVEPLIRNSILNKRRTELINQAKNNIRNEALRKGKIHIEIINNTKI